jgi:hypothetical protein
MITKYALLMGFVTGVAILFSTRNYKIYFTQKTASMFMILVLNTILFYHEYQSRFVSGKEYDE